jgi:hypothetical protein
MQLLRQAMCNDYKLKVDIETIRQDFADIRITIRFPEGMTSRPITAVRSWSRPVTMERLAPSRRACRGSVRPLPAGSLQIEQVS